MAIAAMASSQPAGAGKKAYRIRQAHRAGHQFAQHRRAHAAALPRPWGIDPEFVDAPPDPEAMLATADAALVIGDPALRVRLKVDALSAKQPAGHGCCGGDESEHPVAGVDMLFVYDVAQQWREMTGKPSVLAVWAGRRDVVTPEVVADFLASREYGSANLGEIAEASPDASSPPIRWNATCARAFDYLLDAEKSRGPGILFARCADAGLIPANRPIEFAAAPRSALPAGRARRD